MRKKTSIRLLAAMLALALVAAACGGDSDETAPTTTAPTAEPANNMDEDNNMDESADSDGNSMDESDNSDGMDEDDHDGSSADDKQADNNFRRCDESRPTFRTIIAISESGCSHYTHINSIEPIEIFSRIVRYVNTIWCRRHIPIECATCQYD